MPLRKRLARAMLFAAVGWMAAGAVCVGGGLPVPVQFRNPDDLAVGKLLVASRGMGDDSFAGTVILLVRFDAERGVQGLVLNRRTDVPISEVIDLKSAKGRSDPVYAGGPVELRQVFALIKSPAKVEKAENVFGRVYLISDKTLFDQTLAAHPAQNAFRVYLGYTGWTAAQLRREVQLGAWSILPGEDAAVFRADPGSLWQEMMQKTKVQVAGASPFPDHPRPACAPWSTCSSPPVAWVASAR